MSNLQIDQLVENISRELINKIAKNFTSRDQVFCFTDNITYEAQMIKCQDNRDAVIRAITNCVFETIMKFPEDELESITISNYFDKNETDIIIANVVNEVNKSINTILSNSVPIQNINSLSNLNYESSKCCGNIVFVVEGQNKIPNLIIPFALEEYATEVEFYEKDLKYLRKMLQISNDDLCLVLKLNASNKKWIPLGYAEKTKCKDYIQLSIFGKSTWKISSPFFIVSCEQGHYLIDKNTPGSTTLDGIEIETDKLKAKFPEINTVKLKQLIKKITDTPDIHGGLFVFVDKKQKRKINDLCQYSRGIKIQQSKTLIELNLNSACVNIDALLQLCKIDGALIFDERGVLIAIGTILDGCVNTMGDISRGSRYNSTKTFVDYYTRLKTQKNIKCCGLIISEDNYVNYLSS